MQPEVINLAIIIVNYKTPHMVIDCIQSMDIVELQKLDAHILVVDNHSCDQSIGTIEHLLDKRYESFVTLVESPKNEGFSAGNNFGIHRLKAEYYLLLNSDTLIHPGAILQLVETLRNNPQYALASPRLEWSDGTPQESCFRFHRPVSEMIQSAATRPISKLLHKYIVPMKVADETTCPEWTSFACVLMRADVFAAVGHLDDGFFMYYEDVYFCQKARNAGFKVINNPQARVIHLRGGSSPVKANSSQRKRLPRYYYESRTRYFYQVFGRSGLLAANIFWTLGWMVALTRSLVSRQYRANACNKQWRDIWTNFRRPLNDYVHPEQYQ
jgi:GT2 family glycosyltransferase